MSNEIFNNYGTNPIELLKGWLNEACESEASDPEAVCLATVDAKGHPSVRMVLLKDVSDGGFTFYTNAQSHKGQDIAANSHVSFCMYWKSTRKQIRVDGIVKECSDSEDDTYFATRPIKRQIGAWASKQSQPFEKRAELEDQVLKYEGEFAGVDNIPRPEYWKGYCIIPSSIEFWTAHKDRIHTRFVYTRDDTSEPVWDASWLCP